MRTSKLGAVGLVVLLAGCAAGPPRIELTSPPPAGARALVLVIDGAGGFPSVYKAVSRTVKEQELPLQVVSVEWQHGAGRFIADQTEPQHAREAGRRLAEQVLAIHQQNPALPISLVAHSAGSAVALACGEALPPDSLDRIVLLAPAVSCHYDLRPALATFCSERDWFYLGWGVRVLGTTDGRCDEAAGRKGFQTPPPACAADTALYARLRQHPWDESLCWTGNNGGHTGAYQRIFLRTRIMPLLWPEGR
jgi:pimeloyl-ACP methyl ester carboxylesterase